MNVVKRGPPYYVLSNGQFYGFAKKQSDYQKTDLWNNDQEDTVFLWTWNNGFQGGGIYADGIHVNGFDFSQFEGAVIETKVDTNTGFVSWTLINDSPDCHPCAQNCYDVVCGLCGGDVIANYTYSKLTQGEWYYTVLLNDFGASVELMKPVVPPSKTPCDPPKPWNLPDLPNWYS